MRKKALFLAVILLLGSLQAGCSLEKNGSEADTRQEVWAEDLGTGAEEGMQDAAGQTAENQDPAPGWDSVSSEPDTAEQNTEGASLSLIMVGDILLHTPVAKSGLKEDGSYDFHALFEQMQEEISAADLALVNQEVILGGTDLGVSGYPSFNAPFELGDALAEAGFDVVLHATNHALDKGKKGLLNCLQFWEESHPEIEVLGIHETKEDQNEIFFYEQNGIKIAILNYTYGTNGIELPEDMPFAVDLLDRERIRQDLERADREADFVIVCPHWGTEYKLEPSSAQEKWAQFFLENGTDLVLGTHPHVIEPVEWLGDEEGSRMLVYYSLGNFLNWTSGTGEGVADRMVGGMAKITLARNLQGAVEIQDYGIEAVVCHLEEGFGGVTVYPLRDYTQELAAENKICSQDEDFSLQYCRELCRQVWGDYE